MRVAIIGAGEMGRWFTEFFLKEGASVTISDKNRQTLSKMEDEFGVEVTDNKDAVGNADIILICVPIEDFEDVIKEIHPYTRQNQVILDICTFKEFPVKVMHKYIRKGTILGTHPLFGSYAESIKLQNLILTPTNLREEKFAMNFKRWLESRRARVYIMPSQRHDRFMRTILKLPRMTSFLLYHINRRFPSILSIIYRVLSKRTSQESRSFGHGSIDNFSKKMHYKRWWRKVGFAEPSEARHKTFHNYAKLISSLSKPSSIILDVGCGNGTFLRMLKSEDVNHLIGTDLENVFQQEKDISFIVAETTHLPIRPESIDIAFAKRFVSVSDVRMSLRELSKTIKKDGKILVDVPNMNRLKSRIYRLLRLQVKFLGTKYYPHLHLTSFLRIVSENGLLILQTGGDFVSIPFLGYVTSRLHDGIIEDLIGRFRPDLCSHLFAVCKRGGHK